MAGESFSTHSDEELEAELRAIEEEETRRKGEGSTPDPSEPKDSSKPEDPSEPEDSPAPDELPKESSEDEASREQPRERIKKLGNIAIRANLSRDRDALAKRYAGEALDNKVYSENKIANAIMSFAGKNLFRLASERKMMREIREGKDFTLKNGETTNIEKLIESDTAAIIERFQHGIYDESQTPDDTSLYIHRKIGNEKGKNNLGETYKENEWAADSIRRAIDSFLKSEDNLASIKSGNYHDLKTAFDKHMQDFRESSHKDAENSKRRELFYDNYADVAWNAMLAGQSEKDTDAAIKKINEAAEDIRVYDANVYNGARSEKHHALIDRACEALDARGFTLGADVLAIASGVAAFVGRTATSKFARYAGISASVVSGALATARAYARTRNQYNTDRADMLYNTEVGGVDYFEAELSKREKKISGTIYEMKSATSLIAAIEKASQSNDIKALQEATKEARARIIISDQDRKPLISFTKGKVGDERLKLDIAVIEAEKKLKDTLSEEAFQNYESIRDRAATNLLSIVRENDKDFYKKRNRAAAGRAVLTAGLSVTTYLGLQAIKKAADGTTINANTGTSGNIGSPSERTTIGTIRSDDPDFEKYRSDENYRITLSHTTREKVGSVTSIIEETPSDSSLKANVSYLGWANNGTSASDGNELRVFLQNGKYVSHMYGNSYMGGRAINYESNIDKIKGYITLGNSKFEVVPSEIDGHLSWGDGGGIFTIKGPDGVTSTIKAIDENGNKLFKYFEIAYTEPGAGIDGADGIIPFATDVGRNTYDDLINIEKTIDQYQNVSTYVVEQLTPSTENLTELATEAATGNSNLSERIINRLTSESRNLGNSLSPVLSQIIASIVAPSRTRVSSSPNARPVAQESSSETPGAAPSSLEDVIPIATAEETASSSEVNETAESESPSSETSESTSDSEAPESPSAPEASGNVTESQENIISDYLKSISAAASTYGNTVLGGEFDDFPKQLDLLSNVFWQELNESQQSHFRGLLRDLERTGSSYARGFRNWLAARDAEES